MKVMTWPLLFLLVSFRGALVRAGAGAGPGSSKRLPLRVPPRVLPKTMHQQQYVDALYRTNTSLVLGIGPAGCGKTLLASSYAIEQCVAGRYDKIVLTRPVVPVEEELGYLPGTVRNKMEPWTQPIVDVFEKATSRKEVMQFLEKGTIEIVPLAYMRGRSFQRTLVLADEMQNSSPSQMKMLTTRMGEASKLVVMGDLEQSDLPSSKENGLSDLYRRMLAAPVEWRTEIAMIQFGQDDVVRSQLVKQLLQLYGVVFPQATATTHVMKPRGHPKPRMASKNITRAVPPAPSSGNEDAALLPLYHTSKYFPPGKS